GRASVYVAYWVACLGIYCSGCWHLRRRWNELQDCNWWNVLGLDQQIELEGAADARQNEKWGRVQVELQGCGQINSEGDRSSSVGTPWFGYRGVFPRSCKGLRAISVTPRVDPGRTTGEGGVWLAEPRVGAW